MDQQKAIETAAKHFPYYPDANALVITTDEQVFLKPEVAVLHAIQLRPGNPEAFTVTREEAMSTVAAPVVDITKLSKEQSIEKAKRQLADAEADVITKQVELDAAEPKKKGAKKIALNKANLKVDAAKAALSLVEEMEG